MDLHEILEILRFGFEFCMEFWGYWLIHSLLIPTFYCLAFLFYFLLLLLLLTTYQINWRHVSLLFLFLIFFTLYMAREGCIMGMANKLVGGGLTGSARVVAWHDMAFWRALY